MEHRAGIEPANTGFADQRVSHFATGAHLVTLKGGAGGKPRLRVYLFCLVGEILLRQVPGFYRRPCSAAPVSPPLVRLRASSKVSGWETSSSTREPCGWMLIVCQDSRLARRSRNTPAACGSDRSRNRVCRDVERRLPCLKQEAAGCLASTSFSIELADWGCQTSRMCECARVDHRVVQSANGNKKSKDRQNRVEHFFISWQH